MPSGTTIRQFVDDLRDRKSTICRKLDEHFGSPAALTALQTHALLGTLTAAASLKPLPPALRQELEDRWGLNSKDIKHIEDWPDNLTIRDKLVDSINNVLPLQFYWEIYDGPNAASHTVLPPIGSAGDVIFRSPHSNVRLTSTINWGEMTIDV